MTKIILTYELLVEGISKSHIAKLKSSTGPASAVGSCHKSLY